MEESQPENEIAVTSTDEVQSIPVLSQLVVLAVILLLIFGVGIAPQFMASRDTEGAEQKAALVVTDTNQAVKSEDTTVVFADISITGASAFVLDVSTQHVLWSKSPDVQLPLASVTKLMTALLAQELVTPDTTITISDEAINQDGTSGLNARESFTLSNLSDLILLSSSNDGAYAIAESIGQKLNPDDPAGAFVQAMNVRAVELGLAQTYFRNPTGLDVSEQEAGAYGSARDIAILMQHILRNEPVVLEATRSRMSTMLSEAGYTHTAYNTNPYVEQIPGIIGSKTGYTELAGGNLAVAFEAGINRPVIVVVLGSTQSGRFNDVLTLSKAAQSALQ